MRRGQLGLPFNWILSIVGGGLLLILLVMIAMSILQSGKEDAVRALSFRIENEFRFSGTEHNLFKELEVPNKNFNIVCKMDENGEVTDAHLRIGGASYTEETLLYQPLFAAEAVHGPILSVWARQWHAPMSIGTFLFVDDQWSRFVIVTENHDWVERLVGKLTPFRVDLLSPSQLSSYAHEGDEHYRFILFAGNLSDIPPSYRKKATALLITSKNQGVSGTISFFDDIASTVPNLKTEYYGETMLLASMFAGSSETYQCNMRKADNLLAIAIQVLREKTALLANEAASGVVNHECLAYYGQSREFLDEYARKGILALREDSETISQLQRLNAALSSKGCPSLW